jgi:CheY-like chemotaxis protein
MARDLTLTGRRILLVEDDYFIADDLVAALEARGAEVVGPAASLSHAMTLIENAGRLDGAVLDINLQGESVYPLADALQERSVPFVFATGYDAQTIPARYAHVSVCEKPFGSEQITKAMFG